MIDFSKPVQTTDGRSVKILTTSGHPSYPIVGYIDGDDQPSTWTESGEYDTLNGSHKKDLIQAPFPLDMTKPVRTRSGISVRIFATDSHPNWPIVGLIDGFTMASTWTKEGLHSASSMPGEYDLVNVEEPVNDTFMYLNVYKSDSGYNLAVHEARTSADIYSTDQRVARIRVQIKEGQFDD